MKTQKLSQIKVNKTPGIYDTGYTMYAGIVRAMVVENSNDLVWTIPQWRDGSQTRAPEAGPPTCRVGDRRSGMAQSIRGRRRERGRGGRLTINDQRYTNKNQSKVLAYGHHTRAAPFSPQFQVWVAGMTAFGLCWH